MALPAATAVPGHQSFCEASHIIVPQLVSQRKKPVVYVGNYPSRLGILTRDGCLGGLPALAVAAWGGGCLRRYLGELPVLGTISGAILVGPGPFLQFVQLAYRL